MPGTWQKYPHFYAQRKQFLYLVAQFPVALADR